MSLIAQLNTVMLHYLYGKTSYQSPNELHEGLVSLAVHYWEN
jgi:hypothetical protein